MASASYDQIYSSIQQYHVSNYFMMPLHLALADFAVAEALGPDATVIEMGSGPGYALASLRQKGLEGKMCGLDINPRAGVLGRQTMIRHNGNNNVSTAGISFKTLDATEENSLRQVISDPFGGRKVDLILASSTLHTLPDQRQVLSLWSSILAENGRIVVDWAVDASTQPGETNIQVSCVEMAKFTTERTEPDRTTYVGQSVAVDESWDRCAAAFRALVQGSGLRIHRLEHVKFAPPGMTDVTPSIRSAAATRINKNPAIFKTPEELNAWVADRKIPLWLLEEVGESHVKKQQAKHTILPTASTMGSIAFHRNVQIRADLRKET